MNIAYFMDNVSSHGGVERIIIDKANYLAALPGYGVTVVCLGAQDESGPAYAIDPRVKLHFLDCQFSPTVGLRRPISFTIQWIKWWRHVAKAVKKFYRETPIDLSISLAYDCNRPYRDKKTPHIIESHAYRKQAEQLSITPRLTHFLISTFVTRGADVVTLTAADAAEWPEARRVDVIPNFTNIQPCKPYNPASRKVVAAGRLHDQKGFDLLIKAWKIVHEKFPEHSLEIFGGYGDDQMLPRLQKLAESCGISQYVHLRGVTNDMPAAFAEGEAFVLSSRFEGFPLVLIEAMACGVPPVAFDCPHGPADLVDDGVNGILVPFKNLSDDQRVEQLADGLCRMLALSDDERGRMSEAAMKKAASFSRDAIMDRWVKLFNEVVCG